MNTFRIERVNGEFQVVCYERKWFREKRHILYSVDRLLQAEDILVHRVVEEFSRELDRRRFATVTATIADCEPRESEEHIYTALVLQGIKPPETFEVISLTLFDKYDEAIGRKSTHAESRLFLHRFITWYAKKNPQYNDPRLKPDDPYARAFAPASAAAAAQSTLRRFINRMTGNKHP